MRPTVQQAGFLLTSIATIVFLHMFWRKPTSDVSIIFKNMNANLYKVNPSSVVSMNFKNLNGNVYKVKNRPSRTNYTTREVIRLFDFHQSSPDPSKCYPLKENPSAVICVYEDAKDIFVSKSLRLYGAFEPSIEAIFKQALKHDPELDVIDIGANLGLYSLIAAAMGRKTISVEPLQTNINHFHKSVKMNNFENKISLLTNAVSNQRAKVHFKLNPTNQGGTRMLPKKLSCIDGHCPFAWSILMDDILPLTVKRNITKAIMKIDIEGSEHLAFSNASKLFTALKIPYIFMEFVFQRRFCGPKQADTTDNRLSNRMFSFFKRHGYTRVYASNLKSHILPLNSCSQWPGDVIWVHGSHAYPP